MIPSLIIFAVSASVGTFYFFMTLCLIMAIIGAIICAMGYARNSQDFILAGRVIIIIGMLLAFFDIFGDNLVFDDKTVVKEVLDAQAELVA